MKKAVIIGGKGKVGTYLVPMLCEDGFEVTNVSRGNSAPFVPHGCWSSVEQLSLDRSNPDFAKKIAELEPDVVADMICFKESDMAALTDALEGKVGHYLVCGSVWIHGQGSVVPSSEEDDLKPFGEYGIEKLKMVRTLQKKYALSQFPGTEVHPGHIVGPGHLPVNPQGNKDPKVFSDLIHGNTVCLPNFGMETIHHVHAYDVAGVFRAAIRGGSVSYGQHFHAVSPAAITLRGYAEAVASWFGKEANLTFAPFDVWKKEIDPKEAEMTYDHILRSPSHSMEKAKRLLGFTPRYSSLEAVRECLDRMIADGIVR